MDQSLEIRRKLKQHAPIAINLNNIGATYF